MLHIYKASAGSGKTFALTRQYLSLLLGEHNPDTGKWRLRSAREGAHRHILAITFTNKATQEMTRRIISQLAILARREPDAGADAVSPYLDYFTRLFHTDADTLAQVASDVLDELLADFAYFHVSTIDAFFQNVLRIFAREVEMPDNFRLELDNDATISLGINEMFTSLNYAVPSDPVRRRERKWLTDWLTRLMMRSFDAGNSVNILARSSSLYTNLVNTFSQLLDEQFNINAREITDYLNRGEVADAGGKSVECIAAFENGVYEMVQRKEEGLRAHSIAIMQYGDYKKINRYIRQRIEQWAAGDMKEPNPTVIDAAGNPSKRFEKSYKNPAPELDAQVELLCREAAGLQQTRALTDVLIKAITPLGLLGCLLRHISTFCKDNNVILLSDTNSLLREIINDDETPFVYERLGYYLRHFLIDEVQDTSTLQWANLRPLIMESLGYNHDNLVIGDEKQCIYRFRNSDPALLGHIISDEVTEVFRPDAVSIEGNTIAENNNWRSSREVVTFNNSIFHAIACRYGIMDSYSNVIQQINPKRKAIPGHVSLIFEPEKEEPDGADIAGEEDTDATPFALQTTVNEVDRLLSAGYRKSQIAILVRRHSEGEAVIKQLLQCHEREGWQHGQLEVKSTDAVAIGSSAAVKMVIEILRITQLPQNITTIMERGGKIVTETKENPARRRARLLYCFQYYLHTTVTTPDGVRRNPTNSEALALAIDAIRRSESGDNTATSVDIVTPVKASLKDILDFAAASTSGSSDSAQEGEASSNPTVTCLTLTAIVDKIISRYVIKEVLPEETAFLTSFQDLVYDFCSQGTSDIRSFLAWWDRGGCKSSLSSTSESDAINVMTIHQSKGLEYPCVILPFCNIPMVTYSNSKRLSYNWLHLDSKNFPGIAPEVIPPMIPVEFTSAIPKIDIFAEESRRIIAEQIVDNLNICYVAFTRAVNELIVIAPASKKKTSSEGEFDVPPFNEMLREAVNSLTADNIASDNTLDADSRRWVLPLAELADGDRLEIGSGTSPQEEKGDKGNDSMPIIDLPPYNPEVNDRLVTLTAADIDLFDFDDPRHRGSFLHGVLSKVRRRSDLGPALRRAATRARLNVAQIAECEALLTRALADPQVERWFEGYARLYREQSIATGGTDRRPDRIVILDDGTVEIIDYKFGEFERQYLSQVRRYMSLMRSSGYEKVKGYLWFVTNNTIHEVT